MLIFVFLMRILVIYVYAMLCTLKVISYFCNQFEIIYVYNLKKGKQISVISNILVMYERK